MAHSQVGWEEELSIFCEVASERIRGYVGMGHGQQGQLAGFLWQTSPRKNCGVSQHKIGFKPRNKKGFYE